MSFSKPTKVLILAIGNGVNILINFLALPYLVRSLSYVDYGTYGQVLITISLLQGIFTFNLNQVANIYLAKAENNSASVFKTIFYSSLLLAFLGGLIMLISVPIISSSFNNHGIEMLLYLSIFNLIGQIPIPILLSVLIFYGKVKEVSLVLVATNILKIIIMFVAINFFHSVNYLMLGLSFLSVLQLALLYWFIPNGLRSIGVFDKKLARIIFFLAAPLAITSIIEKLVVYIDGVMISSMLTTTDFAIYRAGAFEVPFVSALYGSVATIVMPEVAKLFANDRFDEIIRLKRKVISTTAFFVYPVLVYLLFFSLPVVVLYLSDKYSSSAIVFAIFNFALLIRINDYQDIIVISGNSKFIFFSVIGLTILNIILNYILISTIGINGGAISYIVHLILLAGLLTFKTTKIMSCSFFDIFDIKTIAKILAISVLLSFIIWMIYNWTGNSVYFVVGLAPIYFIVFLFVGYKLKLIEENIFNQMFSKFNKKFK